MIIKYNAKLDIRNTDQLPKGSGAKYLLCIKGIDKELIASQWKRKKPSRLGKQEILVAF